MGLAIEVVTNLEVGTQAPTLGAGSPTPDLLCRMVLI